MWINKPQAPKLCFASKKMHGVLLPWQVINTRHRMKAKPPSDSGGVGSGRNEQLPFDGRALLRTHGSLDLGVLQLQELHLSMRGKYDDQSDYYFCAAKLPLK